MKALYTSSPGEYFLAERPVPIPGPDEALIKVIRAGICHTDVIIRAGGASHVRYPVIPGHEFAGVVESCGSASRFVKPGDRVAVHSILGCGQCPGCRKGDVATCENLDELGSKRDGGFGKYCTAPVRVLYKLPDHVTFEEAAMLEPLANAVSALRQAGIRTGDRVVIIGPGPIGLMAAQLARYSNPLVLALVGTRDERLALGKELAGAHTVNVTKSGAAAELKDLLGGKGADVILDCAGTPGAWELMMDIAAFRCRICIEGAYDVGQMMPIAPYSFLVVRAITIMGICGWLTVDFTNALEYLSRGLVNVKKLHTHTFPLDEWEAAFEMATKRKSEAVKVELAP